MSNSKVKVLNISGWGRSGSTIVGSVMGQFDGFFYGGELRNVWNMSLIRNRLCGCGVEFKECELWKKIFNEAFGGMEKVDASKITKIMQSTTRSRHIPLRFLPFADKLFILRLGEYLDAVGKLFTSIKSITNNKVIVDSSKSSLYGYALSLIDEIDVYVVHLIRDPRGVAYSRQKTMLQPNNGEEIYMQKFSTFDSSLIWDIRNIATESYWKSKSRKYLMVRYEDFVSSPKKTVSKILDFIGENPSLLPFVTDNKIEIKQNHSVWGNPSRFKTGLVELKLDEEWKHKMNKLNKFVSTALTLPWLLKYGYLANNTKDKNS